MPAPVKKNASVILYDVNCKPEFQKAAKNCLLNIFGCKWFSDSKDCTKLVLVNTQESNNQLHTKFGQAPHISEVTDVIQYDPNLVNPHLEDAKTGQGDWLVALAVAIEELKDNYSEDKGVMTLQILFITDFSSPVKELKEKRVNFIISNLNTLNIFLYIIGPEVKVPTQMFTVEDVRRWAKDIEFVNNGNDNQLRVVQQIVKNTKNSVVCDLSLGQDLFLNYRNYWGLQAWQVPLSAGTSVTFPTVTTRFLRAVAPPKIKAEKLVKTPWKWVLIDDVMIEVPYDNVIGGVVRHGKFVPLPSDVEKNFKYYGERAFKIIGFTDRRNVSEIYTCGDGSSCVQSDSKSFGLLLNTLFKKNMCAIARKIYMKNCKPKLVALLPEPEENLFILVEMPYKENISFKINEQEAREAPTIDKPSVKEVYDFLSTLDITNEENISENSPLKFPLAPTLMTPTRLNQINKSLLKKYIGDEFNPEDNTNLQVNDGVMPYLQLCPPRAAAETTSS